jgi:hypothetical protein
MPEPNDVSEPLHPLTKLFREEMEKSVVPQEFLERDLLKWCIEEEAKRQASDQLSDIAKQEIKKPSPPSEAPPASLALKAVEGKIHQKKVVLKLHEPGTNGISLTPLLASHFYSNPLVNQIQVQLELISNEMNDSEAIVSVLPGPDRPMTVRVHLPDIFDEFFVIGTNPTGMLLEMSSDPLIVMPSSIGDSNNAHLISLELCAPPQGASEAH